MRNVMAVLFVCLLSATTLAGITRTYTGGTSWIYGWDIATNWSPNGVPEAGDTVTIGGNRKVIINQPENGLSAVYVAYSTSTTATQATYEFTVHLIIRPSAAHLARTRSMCRM